MNRKFSASLLTFVLAVLGGCGDKNINEDPVPDPTSLKDQFRFEDRVRRIESAIYEENSADGSYVFWFSPTGNILDREGMELADDFIRVTTPERPRGELDMSREGCELSYGDMVINPYTIDNYKGVNVSIDLNSAKTVKLNAEATSPAGASLCAKYYNLCYPSGYKPGDDPGKEEDKEIVMDRVIYQYYFGVSKAGTRNYYLLVTNADYTMGNTIKLEKSGYILILDLYCDNDGNVHVLPAGSFREDDKNTNFTYSPKTSGVIYYDENLKPSSYFVEKDVEVVANEDGTLSFTAHFYDADDNFRTMTFTGSERFESYTPGYYNPQIDRDVVIEGFSANASYQGNVFDTATGLMQISIVDEEYAKNPSDVEGGYGLCIVVYSDLFGNSRDCKLMPGTYFPSQKFGEWGSWMPAQEINYMGYIVPLGTYVHYNDGTSYGRFMYMTSGTINIEASPLGWKLDWDLQSAGEYTAKGSYEGPIQITDESDDDDKDDGTSTIERDYEMDLSYIKSATLLTDDQVYIKKLGYRPASRWNVGIQMVGIGKRSGTDMSDICWLEFLTEPGKELYLEPGSYPVADNNYPDAYFEPGVACAGTLLAYEDRGCYWRSFYHVGDYHEGYLDGHAYFYEGNIDVSYNEESGEYTFDIDGICVRRHHVTDTWTGPVYTAGGVKVTPCPEGSAAASSVKTKANASAMGRSTVFGRPAKELAPYAGVTPFVKINPEK
ncbi:MAG: hypothetical protein HUJ94_08455 [Bacteroidales bacterium]|nr:hypothetical protein [Bacteroidales bacterium]